MKNTLFPGISCHSRSEISLKMENKTKYRDTWLRQTGQCIRSDVKGNMSMRLLIFFLHVDMCGIRFSENNVALRFI